VSVEFPGALPAGVSPINLDFSYPLTQPSFDDKPLEDLFSFDSFPINESDVHVDQSSHLVDHPDFFATCVFDPLVSDSFSLSDQFDAKPFDMQTTSGAATACDDVVLATEF
jgi:transcriptional activator HAC1